MPALPRFAIRRPRATLALAAVAILAAAPGLLRLELRTDGHALIPPKAPEVVYDAAVRAAFGVRDPLVVVVRTGHPDGVWNPATLRRVRDLTAALQELPGVGPAGLISLATEHGGRLRPGTFRPETFLERLPADRAGCRELRAEVLGVGLYLGTLVGRDERSAAILLGTPPGADRADLVRRIRKLAERGGPHPDAVEVLGAPVAEALLGRHLLADLGVPPALLGSPDGEDGRGLPLVPLALALLGAALWAGFRRPAPALLPLVKLGACLGITFGVMGWAGVPLYLTTAVLPVVLIAVGVADEVHLFRRFGELAGERPGLPSANLASATLDEMANPVIQTSVTTAAGLLSFAVAPIGPVRAFGLFAAFGVLVCLLWSLAVTPALLALTPPRLWAPRRRAGAPAAGRGERAFAALARGAVRHRRAVLAAAALAALAALDGVRRIEVQDSWVGGFDPESGFARAVRRFDREYHGSHLLLVAVAAAPRQTGGTVAAEGVGDERLTVPLPPSLPDPAGLAGGWLRVFQLHSPDRPQPQEWSAWVAAARAEGGALVLDLPLRSGSPRFWLRPAPGETLGWEARLQPFMVPGTLARVGALERFLAGRPEVGGVLGPAGSLEAVAALVARHAPGARPAAGGLPERPDEVRPLWSHFGRIAGPERLRQLVDPEEYGRCLVTVFLPGADYARVRRLMAELRAYERSHLAPAGLALGFAGDAAVSQALIAGVVRTEGLSLALSLAGIFAVTALLGRSLQRGLYSVLPPAFAVLVAFALMGWLGIPLGVATSMFAGMTLGIGVDYAIHLLARFQRVRDTDLDGEEALARALASTGPAILLDALSVGLGFAVLLCSRVPTNARLGALLAITVVGCLAAALTLVPALLAALPLRQEAPAPEPATPCPAASSALRSSRSRPG